MCNTALSFFGKETLLKLSNLQERETTHSEKKKTWTQLRPTQTAL